VLHPDRINDDLPRCIRGHGGGPFANPFLNAAQRLQYAATPDLLLFAHGRSGAPHFDDWPSFLGGAHEQMHVTQIRRNFDGGLRLMVALATDNLGAEYLGSPVEGGRVRLVDERTSLEAQLAAMTDLARRNAAWMQIAYSAGEARDAILHNRLAVVLGVETDQLGTYTQGTPADEVDYLWNRGVRVITPIHAMNNKIGGAAAFIGPYNWLNDLFHRSQFDVTKAELAHVPPAFFEVQGAPCDPKTTTNDGECVQARMETVQNRLYIGRCLESLFRLSPCLQPEKVDAYERETHGHVNASGLTPFGREVLRAMMNRGIILDTAHMSDKSVRDTYDLMGQWPTAYPAIISHAHFRAQAFYGQPEFAPSEYDISNSNLDKVRQAGGVVGPFVAEDRVSLPWDETGQRPFDNDCAFSSKSFGYAFHFALTRMGGTGVAMATDSTFIPQTGPRFGAKACWGYRLAKDPSKERRKNPERYAMAKQIDGVVYENMPRKKGVVTGTNLPLSSYRMNGRRFDYNVDGLAHFGMVPDLLQDLKNLRLPRSDLEALFDSADGYLRMWERTEHAAASAKPGAR
jgi:microsomal dipeptidase-like Zn-dependent dipeptidase